MNIELKGKKVARTGTKKGLWFRAVVDGEAQLVFISPTFGISAGDLLIGNAEIGKKSYTTDADGKPLDKPVERYELVDYVSLKDQNTVKEAYAESKKLDKEIAQQYGITMEEVAAFIG